MASTSRDFTKDWELPICQSSLNASEHFEELLKQFRYLHSKLCARNSYLESEFLRLSHNRGDFTTLPVPQEWASTSEVMTMIGQLAPHHASQNGEIVQVPEPPCTPGKSYASQHIFSEMRPPPCNGDMLDPLRSPSRGPVTEQSSEKRRSSNSDESVQSESEQILDRERSKKASVKCRLSEERRQSSFRQSSFRPSAFRQTSFRTSSFRQSEYSGTSSTTSENARKRQSKWRVAQGSTKDFRNSAVMRKSIHTDMANFRVLLMMIATSNYFVAVYSTILLSYAIFVAVETEVVALNPEQEMTGITVTHVIFSIFFTVELFIRLGAEGWEFFVGKSALFNWFDTMLVLSNVVDLTLAVMSANIPVGAAGPMMRTLRIARVVRTMRLFRAFHHLHEFQKMAFAIASSFKTLLCSILVVFFTMFFYAVVFTQGAADLDLRANIQDLEMRYGDLSATMYTLFLSVSAGISWEYAHAPLEEMGSWFGYAFISYIVISLFGVLNVVTSIFVESVIRSSQHHRDVIVQDKEKEKYVTMGHMQEVFRQVDRDGSGQVTSDELEYFLNEPELRKYMEALDVSPEDTRLLFRLLDRDASDVIDIEEFCEGCLRLKGNARSIDMQTLIFQMKNFLGRWAEFTDYVQERFDQLEDSGDHSQKDSQRDSQRDSHRGSHR